MLVHSLTPLCVSGFHLKALSYVSLSLQALAGHMVQMCDWMCCSLLLPLILSIYY